MIYKVIVVLIKSDKKSDIAAKTKENKMSAAIPKSQSISDMHSVEMHREINEKNSPVYGGSSDVSPGGVPGFTKGPLIASKDSGGKKSVKPTKV